MKIQHLIILLIMGIFIGEAQAMKPSKGGATGGAAAGHDINSCDLKPQSQTKIKIKDKTGKFHYICTGQAICGGQAVPVSCKVNERELCPVAKKCVKFEAPTVAVKCKGQLKISDSEIYNEFSDSSLFVGTNEAKEPIAIFSTMTCCEFVGTQKYNRNLTVKLDLKEKNPDGTSPVKKGSLVVTENSYLLEVEAPIPNSKNAEIIVHEDKHTFIIERILHNIPNQNPRGPTLKALGKIYCE